MLHKYKYAKMNNITLALRSSNDAPSESSN